ncbi:MAG: chemotaxis protein CheW [Oscillospiraceae bacterium]|nr:chemotaxis protein CheW [Oscillospiraceae bacterium]
MQEAGTGAANHIAEMDNRYLTFWTQSQLFGIPIADVVQIVGMQPITSIPEFPVFAKGVMNLRGSIIPVIDVRLRFGKEEQVYNERTCIVVTLINQKQVGFIVDEVDEVAYISREDIAEPPLVAKEKSNAYLMGVAKQADKIILLLDTAKVLSQETLTTLAQQGQEGE